MNRIFRSKFTIGASALLLSVVLVGEAPQWAGAVPSARLASLSDCAVFARSHPGAGVTSVGKYVMASIAGPSEMMYTLAQAKALHPKTGEIMVRGQMTGMGGPSMSMAMGSTRQMRHIEVHICSKATGKALVGAQPLMRVRDLTRGSSWSKIPVAEMLGLDHNMADTHYGNNVAIVPGHRYDLQTTISSQSGTFRFTAPNA